MMTSRLFWAMLKIMDFGPSIHVSISWSICILTLNLQSTKLKSLLELVHYLVNSSLPLLLLTSWTLSSQTRKMSGRISGSELSKHAKNLWILLTESSEKHFSKLKDKSDWLYLHALLNKIIKNKVMHCLTHYLKNRRIMVPCPVYTS